jgi:hypothetical protein
MELVSSQKTRLGSSVYFLFFKGTDGARLVPKDETRFMTKLIGQVRLNRSI